MDAKDNQRKEERCAFKSSAKIAFYVPVEYEGCYGANHFKAEIVDGSIMPANPGVNPTLTISALAEYAMSQIPVKDGKILTNSNAL